MVQDEISHEGYKDKNERRGEAKSDVFYLSAMQVGYRASAIDSGTPSVKGTGQGASGA